MLFKEYPGDYSWGYNPRYFFADNYLAGYRVSHFPANETWHEWTNDYDIESGDDNILIDLPEYEAKVLVWQS